MAEIPHVFQKCRGGRLNLNLVVVIFKTERYRGDLVVFHEYVVGITGPVTLEKRTPSVSFVTIARVPPRFSHKFC